MFTGRLSVVTNILTEHERTSVQFIIGIKTLLSQSTPTLTQPNMVQFLIVRQCASLVAVNFSTCTNNRFAMPSTQQNTPPILIKWLDDQAIVPT